MFLSADKEAARNETNVHYYTRYGTIPSLNNVIRLIFSLDKYKYVHTVDLWDVAKTLYTMESHDCMISDKCPVLNNKF